MIDSHTLGKSTAPAARADGDPGEPRPAPSAPVPQPPAPQAIEHHEEEIPKNLRRPHFLTVAAATLLFLALLAGLFVLGWAPHERQQKLAADDAGAADGAIPIVAVTSPKRSVGMHEIVLPCDIRPAQETLIFPRATGYLKKLNVDIQDHVQAGQLLAEIDTPEVDAQLEQARAALAQAKADVDKAKADLELAQRTLTRYLTVNTSSVAQQERDEKLAARDQAQAGVAQVQASVVAAEANVQRLVVLQGFEKITAPFAGVITARNYDLGTLISASSGGSGAGGGAGGGGAGRELFRLTQSDTLRVYVNMPQGESSDVKPGQKATLTVRNFPNHPFEGKVARLAGALDPSSRTMPFELHFDNPGNLLFAGMYGQVALEVSEPAPALLVPTSSLVFNAGGTQVALVRDGKIHFQSVAVGRDFGTELEVPSGLTTDDRVITNPGERLAEGVQVQVIQPVAASTPKK